MKDNTRHGLLIIGLTVMCVFMFIVLNYNQFVVEDNYKLEYDSKYTGILESIDMDGNLIILEFDNKTIVAIRGQFHYPIIITPGETYTVFIADGRINEIWFGDA